MAVTIGSSGVTFNDSTVQTSGWTTTVFGGASIVPSTGVTATFPTSWKRIEIITQGPYSGGSPVNVSQMTFYDLAGSFAAGSTRVSNGNNGTNVYASSPNYRTYSGSTGTLAAPINGTTSGWNTSMWVIQKIPNSSAIHISGEAHSDQFVGFYTGWQNGQSGLTSCKYTFTLSTSQSMYITMRSFN